MMNNIFYKLYYLLNNLNGALLLDSYLKPLPHGPINSKKNSGALLF